mgnify:CR=1 FL=1|jgi:hypothetical protein
MADLKLARLPDRTPVKLTISLSPDTKKALDEYLVLYRTTYQDSTVSIADIAPAMLESFLASDRAFTRRRKR